jgi:hypothetical protein
LRTASVGDAEEHGQLLHERGDNTLLEIKKHKINY